MHKQNITNFVNAVIKGDKDGARAAFAPIITHVSRETLGLPTANSVIKESMQLKLLRERFENHDSPIKLDMDSVIVDGKKVGTIQTNYDNFDDDGINFIELGGKFSKEFDDVESMFRFLIQRYSREGGAV